MEEATCDIAAALRAEVEEIGSEHAVFVLGNYATRPRLVAVSSSLDWIAQTKPEVTNA